MAGTGKVRLSPQRLALLSDLLRAEGIDRAGRGVTRRPDPRLPVPLTAAQSRMWFLDHLADGAAYVITAALRLRGAVDLGAFERALADVVARHEALRTVFVEVDGVPVQQVRADLPPEVRSHDLTGRPAGDVADEVSRRYAELAARPFDLRTGPLLRVELLRVGESEAVVLLCVHHIVADQWSMGVLIGELMGRYAGRDLPDLPVQYPDYAVWESGSEAEWRDDLAYWVRRLHGAPAELCLVTDRPRPEERSPGGASVPIAVPAALVADLRAVATAENATLYMVLAAVFAVLLRRLGGSDDIVVGTPVANRPLPELEPLVGLFTNTVVLRADASGNPTFREFLARVRQVCLEAFEHQRVPFGRVVDAVRAERSLARTPLFQVMFAYQNAPLPVLAGGPVHVEAVAMPVRTAKLDLTLNLFEDGDSIFGQLEYSTDIFEADRVTAMGRYLRRLLDGVAADPGRRIGDLPLLDPDERAALLALGRGTVRAHWEGGSTGRTVPGAFAARVAADPHAAAVTCAGTTVSYATLDAASNRLARLLIARGVRSEHIVALLMPRSIDMVVTILAVLKAGAAYLPMEPDLPPARLAFMTGDAAAVLAVTVSSCAASLDGAAVDPVVVDEPATRAQIDAQDPGPVTDAHRLAPLRPEHLAYVIYTSGSTGRPKGVAVTHRNVTRLFEALAPVVDMGPAQVWSFFHSYAFDFSVWEIWGALFHGGRVVVVPKELTRSPADFLRLLADERVTVLSQTPSAFFALAQADEQDAALSRRLALRYVVFGGEALDPSRLRGWFDRHGDQMPLLVNMYGITETTVHTTTRVLSRRDAERSLSVIGRGLPDLDLYLLDEGGQPVPVDTPGELYVAGAGVARGYLNRADLTAARFVEDPLGGSRMYRTGDLARWTRTGELIFLGRADDQVKIRGFRIELGEIESVLAGCDGVAQAAVSVHESAAGDRRLAAYLVPAAGPQASTDVDLVADVRVRAAERLPAYMVPSAFTLVPALPLTANGKIDRAALPEPDFADTGSRTVFVAPRDDLERAIAELFARAVGAPRVGVHDNFFAAGGHSLLAVQLAAQITAAHGVRMPVREVFERPTVAELAAWVREGAALGRTGAVIPRAADSDRAPLSFAQEELCLHHPVGVEEPYHNVPLAISLTGGLDEAALRGALDDLVRRHEVLRTRVVHGSPYWHQVVEPAGSWPLTRLDVPDREAALRTVEDEARRRFTLDDGPLVRATLLRLAADEHVLALVMHHLVIDNWSYGVLVRDLCACYSARLAGREPDLPRLPIQYRDYAVWQREQMRSGALAAAAAYWERQLKGLPVLVLDAPQRQRAGAATGCTRPFALDSAVTAALADIGRGERTTLFAVLVAAFHVLLSAYSGRDDVAVSYPEASRDRPETADLLGYFVNQLVVRSDLSGAPTFRMLVRQIRDTVRESRAYEGFPLWSLDPAGGGGADPGRIVFNLLNAPVPELSLPGLSAAALRTGGHYVADEVVGEIHADRVDLALVMRETEAGLRGMWLYSVDRIDARVLDVLMRRWADLLDRVVAEPDRGVDELRRWLAGSSTEAGD